MCFEDDFHNRVRKHLQAKFRESVIPSHLVPYLQCLTKVDEVGSYVLILDNTTLRTVFANECNLSNCSHFG